MWIWIDDKGVPELNRCRRTVFEKHINPASDFAVVEFAKDFKFESAVESLRLRVSADTAYEISVNGCPLWSGPAPIGGDWLPLSRIPKYFFDEKTVSLDGQNSFEISATVRLGPIRSNEVSLGKGGFFLEGVVNFADGSTCEIVSDTSWKSRRRMDFINGDHYDGRLDRSQWAGSVAVEDIWHPEPSGIPVRQVTCVRPTDGEFIMVAPGEELQRSVPFDKIYSGYACISADGPCEVSCAFFELFPDKPHAYEHIIFRENESFYRSQALQSIGGINLKIKNLSATEFVNLHTTVDFTCYPVKEEGSFKCSDKGLEDVYNVCKWTLQICRQDMHLDSPRHQEPLACTGDYYIESLMTAFTFGDMRLAAADIRRTAGTLEVNDGRLFHTTYSLIWVKMLRDVFMFTGERKLLSDCLPALRLLLRRFRTYIGDNGLIENPPDYMFVDWLVVNSFSMHHPPKALGQTVMNAFYHWALLSATEIFDTLGLESDAASMRKHATMLREACNKLLYDNEKQLYFDGLDTPSLNPNQWLPENVSIKNFSRHSNILAILCGLRDGPDAANLLRRTLTSNMQEVQPYFMHFVLEAIDRCGLFAEYGMDILRKWTPSVNECKKGLKEGWFAPQKGYTFDYSHAWGGTPAYQLPARLLGFKMLKPGFSEIELTPRLYGLDSAEIKMPTPFGMLCCSMKSGKKPIIEIPKGLKAKIN